MVRWILRIALLLLALAMLLALAGWWALRGSLPVLDGEAALAGLSAPVTVSRDALGVATIEAAGETDAMRAPHQVHLEEALLRVHVAERAQRVRFPGGLHGHHAQRVAGHGDLRREPGQRRLAIEPRQAPAHRPPGRQQQQRDDDGE